MTGLRVERLRCEHLADPLGIQTDRPRLSWQVRAERSNTTQRAYQVLAAGTPQLLAAGVGDLWDTGRVESAECVLVPYDGAALTSRRRVWWCVRVWDEREAVSDFSAPGRFELGLLDPADWQAQWIAAPGVVEPSGVTYLRTTLQLDGPVDRARAYITALGLYELWCNGRRVGDARFTPGWTDYATRLQYQVLALEDLLHPGENTLQAVLVDGWYAGYIGFLGGREHYGHTPQLLAQIEVDTTAGRLVQATGASWQAGTGQLCSSDMLQGETRDLRRTVGGWQPARLTEGTPAPRIVSPAPPVRVLAELPVVSTSRTPDGSIRVDFGQNLVGWVSLRLSGHAGTTVRVQHAEVLRPDGSLYLDNLRTAAATDSYVLAGEPVQVEPTFTFHGFRYAEISADAASWSASDITAVVCGSDLEQTGDFACSDEGVNQLHSNIVWGARGNFFDIPTDCPQRDERMGWTGDAQVFAPTACYLFDTAGFFTKWLDDLTDAQSTDGSFPDVAPRVLLDPGGSAGWADAGVVLPTVLWHFYSDTRLLTRAYPSMRRWVDYVRRANPDLLWLNARGYDNGDWLAAHAETDKDLIATAYFARSARLTARAADVLGLPEAHELHLLADDITAAFRGRFLDGAGRLICPTQTAHALALRFGLLPETDVADAVARLAEDVQQHDVHLTTGFLGVGQLLPALTDGGQVSLAYALLLQDEYPSWLHAVRSGATTIWERWDGWTAEAGHGDPAMNSYNHYALGSVGEWLYRDVAGIRYDDAGGRTLVLAPAVNPALTWARARHLSPYGPVHCGWEYHADGTVQIDVEVPVGATATLRLPESTSIRLGPGARTFRIPAPQPSTYTASPSTEGSRHVRT